MVTLPVDSKSLTQHSHSKRRAEMIIVYYFAAHCLSMYISFILFGILQIAWVDQSPVQKFYNYHNSRWVVSTQPTAVVLDTFIYGAVITYKE